MNARPRIVSSATSVPFIVRDAMLARAQAMPAFAGFNFTTDKNLQVQPENIPLLGIYYINDDELPDGDINVGEPRFKTMALYGFMILIQNNDATNAEYTLDALWSILTNGLFTDPSLYLNKLAKIQGYARGNRTHQFGSTGKDNKIPTAECRYTLTLDLGVIDYPPVVPDELRLVHLETRYPAGSDPAVVQQTVAEYDLWTTTYALALAGGGYPVSIADLVMTDSK